MNKHIIYIIVIGLLVGLFLYSWFGREPKTIEVVKEVHTSDTVTIIEKDTILAEITKFISEKVIDTIFIKKNENNGFFMPITQRYFKGDEYELWISGYKPTLDKLLLYPETKTEYITNTTTITEQVKTYGLYLDVGFMYMNQDFAPKIALSLTTPKNWKFGVGVAYYQRKAGFELNVGYKIL